MALQTSGPISLADIQTEFGGASPTSISEYYKGGTYVPNTPTNASVPTSGTISIGNFYGAAAYTADTTPDAFYFTNTTPRDTDRNTITYSNTVTITGINAGTSISISGGEYSINGGGWTSSSGTIYNNNTLQLRVTSSNSSGGTVSVFVNVGGVSDTWTVTSYYDLAGYLSTADMSGTSTYYNWDGESTNSQEQLTVSTSSDSASIGNTGYGTISYTWEFITETNTGASLVYISGGFANKYSSSTNIVATYKLATGQSGSSLSGTIQGSYRCIVSDSNGNSITLTQASGGFNSFYAATFNFQT